MSKAEIAIPKGSWILVTGVTGYVGAQVAKQFLQRGYKVRGTVRNLDSASWLTGDVFKTYAEKSSFELALVPDMSVVNAFEQSMRGVAAVAHVASVTTFEPDAAKVIPETVQGVQNILETAAREPSVREFVYTSSIVATIFPAAGLELHVDQDTWNEAVLPLAWGTDRTENHGAFVYMASKVEAEKALWKFVKDRKPHFTVNSVCPSSIMGEPLNKRHVGDNAWMKLLYDGNIEKLQGFGASKCFSALRQFSCLQVSLILYSSPVIRPANHLSAFNSDVKDVALLHVVAVLDPEVKDTRLMAWGDNCNWNDILAIMRRLYPHHKYVDNLPNMSTMSLTSDLSLPLALLKKWNGQDGWRSLEETVRDDVGTFVAWEN